MKLRNNETNLHLVLKQIFRQNPAYHQNMVQSQCRSKNNKQHYLSSITYSIDFKKMQVPSFFALSKRHLLVLLQARIRNNCSNLQNDLFNKNLCNNPLCSWCNKIEDVKHYFFLCNKYSKEHRLFFKRAGVFQPFTTNLSLYDNDTLNNQLNIIALYSAVHEDIKNTKRFDNT